MKVEDQIELTNGCEEFVEQFDEQMDGLQISEFVVVRIDRETEVQTRVTAVYQLISAELIPVTQRNTTHSNGTHRNTNGSELVRCLSAMCSGVRGGSVQ